MTLQTFAPTHVSYHVLPGLRTGAEQTLVVSTADGVRLAQPSDVPHNDGKSVQHWYRWKRPAANPDSLPDLVWAIGAQGMAYGAWPPPNCGVEATVYESIEKDSTDCVTTRVLALPRSERWRKAVTTALLGPWCDPLRDGGQLPTTALGALKAEARTIHRQLVPLSRRGTRHGRVLSLDAALGDGMTLYDLVVSEIDFLAHTAGRVFEDERLNRVLRALTPAERAVVFAYAEGEGTTWTEAAAVAGATAPDAFGQQVRRKTRRLAAEQHRRAAQQRPTPPV